MSCDEVVHVALCPHEARALAHAGEFLCQLLGDHSYVYVGEHPVLPLDSAILKLEVAMACEGVSR